MIWDTQHSSPQTHALIGWRAAMSKMLAHCEVLYIPVSVARAKMAKAFLLLRRHPMLATIKWNSRYNAREWVMTAGALVVQLSALNAKRQKRESKPRRPLWKHFDDTHHWDSTAEEWVPNHDR
jgi:hypothetical protein